MPPKRYRAPPLDAKPTHARADGAVTGSVTEADQACHAPGGLVTRSLRPRNSPNKGEKARRTQSDRRAGQRESEKVPGHVPNFGIS